MAKGRLFKRLAIGAAIAGAAGYLVGIITAPKSGRQTRADFKKASLHGKDEVEEQLEELQSELGDLISQAKGKGGDLSAKAQRELKQLVSQAHDSKDKIVEVVSSLKAGKAQDKDLDKALSDAKHALEHIKDFLRK